MNPTVTVTLLTGAVFGAGMGLLVLLTAPTSTFVQPSLRDALAVDRTGVGTRVREQEDLLTGGRRRRETRLARWAVAFEARAAVLPVRTPDSDLELVEWSRGRFIAVKLLVAVFAVLLGPVYWAFITLLGGAMDFVVPQAVSILLGLMAYVTPNLYVRGRAVERRLEMREAVVAYLILLALYKASGDTMIGALQRAAGESQAWTFRRIDARVAAAIRAGGSPQQGLRALGDELGIRELGDIAEIAQTASVEGAGVFTTLLARANGLRNEMQTAAEAGAAARSVRLALPKTMLVFAGILFLLYPLINSVG